MSAHEAVDQKQMGTELFDIFTEWSEMAVTLEYFCNALRMCETL